MTPPPALSSPPPSNRIVSRLVRRRALLVGSGVGMLVFGALLFEALLLGALPAAADNGPHVNGTGVLTDSCAGCHRLHTAKTDSLTITPQPQLCYTCHGNTGTGAATDVEDGVAADGGALRGGGFKYALIDAANWSGATTNFRNTTGLVPALDNGRREPVTSSHSVDGADALAYGNGPVSTTASTGTTIQLRCGSCHDPHGNGNYRVLRPIPLQSGAGGAVAVPETAGAPKVYTTSNYWQATDANEPNFIANVAAWCSTCHTRYLAPADSGAKDSGDAVFAYRHRSDSTLPGRPSCIQCHVAHGTNATVAAPPNDPHPPGSISTQVAHPDERTGGPLPGGGSRLLRIKDQDTCRMCHNL